MHAGVVVDGLTPLTRTMGSLLSAAVHLDRGGEDSSGCRPQGPAGYATAIYADSGPLGIQNATRHLAAQCFQGQRTSTIDAHGRCMYTLVVFRGADVVAFAHVYFTTLPSNAWSLWNVCVAPTHRGRGLCSHMVATLVHFIHELCVVPPVITIVVDVDNTIATRCYTRAGFVVTARVEHCLLLTFTSPAPASAPERQPRHHPHPSPAVVPIDGTPLCTPCIDTSLRDGFETPPNESRPEHGPAQ